MHALSARPLLSVAAVCIFATAADGDPITANREITYEGQLVGTMRIFDYFAGKVDLDGGMQAQGNIAGNFEKTNAAGTAITAAANMKLRDIAPLGLTYMQATRFTFDSGNQQRFFLDSGGNNIRGWVSDAPQGGFLQPTGIRTPANQMQPWYADIPGPTGPGQEPSMRTWGPGSQFYDRPHVVFDDLLNGEGVAVADGLLKLLDKRNGTWEFETLLVGVQSIPANRLASPYCVVPLLAWKWGLNMMYTGDGTRNTVADYSVTQIDLGFAPTPSADMAGCYDRNPERSEWSVCFVPGPGGVGALLGTALLAARRRRTDQG